MFTGRNLKERRIRRCAIFNKTQKDFFFNEAQKFLGSLKILWWRGVRKLSTNSCSEKLGTKLQTKYLCFITFPHRLAFLYGVNSLSHWLPILPNHQSALPIDDSQIFFEGSVFCSRILIPEDQILNRPRIPRIRWCIENLVLRDQLSRPQGAITRFSYSIPYSNMSSMLEYGRVSGSSLRNRKR